MTEKPCKMGQIWWDFNFGSVRVGSIMYRLQHGLECIMRV